MFYYFVRNKEIKDKKITEKKILCKLNMNINIFQNCFIEHRVPRARFDPRDMICSNSFGKGPLDNFYSKYKRCGPCVLRQERVFKSWFWKPILDKLTYLCNWHKPFWPFCLRVNFVIYVCIYIDWAVDAHSTFGLVI